MPEDSTVNDPEHGLLSRIRSWRDIFPWLAIADALRPATTLAAILLSSIATALSVGLDHVTVHFISNPNRLSAPVNLPVDAQSLSLTDWLYAPFAVIIDALRLLGGPSWQLLTSVNSDTPLTDMAVWLTQQFLILCIWAIPAGFIIRQSGLAMGGRLLRGTVETLRLVASRFLGYMGVAFIPCLILFCVLCYFGATALAFKIPTVGIYVGAALDVIGIPIALAAGLLGFSSFLAIPLGWAAVSLERDGSSFDGISRGYEYTLRRPIQWSCLLVLAFIVTYILVAISQAVTHVAATTISLAATVLRSLPTTPRPSLEILQYIPLVMALTVIMSLVAWLYLLLRQSANHQEVEDLWEQPHPEQLPLPKLT